MYDQKLATEVLFPHQRHLRLSHRETHFKFSGESTWWMIGPNTLALGLAIVVSFDFFPTHERRIDRGKVP